MHATLTPPAWYDALYVDDDYPAEPDPACWHLLCDDGTEDWFSPADLVDTISSLPTASFTLSLCT